MTEPYIERRIETTITLGEGNFGETGKNTVTLRGLRVSANIVQAGDLSMGSLQLRIYGMTLSKMNQLSTLGLRITEVRKNSVLIRAGDDKSGLASVFEGTIHEAWADFQGAPRVVFNLQAAAGLAAAIKPVAPRSYRGAADVVTIMKDLAGMLDYTLENGGVTGVLDNPYFPGTVRDQIAACAEHAHIDFILEDETQTLAIWPKNGSRGGLIPLISPMTGMVGYPTFTSQGISFTTRYNNGLKFGSLLKLESSIKPACGMWKIQTLAHNLESETPNGAWFTSVEANRPEYAPTISH